MALPLAAAAQPAAESDTSREVSQLVAEAQRATAAPDVVVQACRMPADSEGYDTRSSRLRPTNNSTHLPIQAGETEESPGAREFILRNIVGFRSGTADFAHMDPALSQVTRTNLPLEKLWIGCRGAFKAINFLHVSQDGYDDFEADFSGAAIEWEVEPLNTRQVTRQWAARFYYPEPTTRRFDDFLKSMERGSPGLRPPRA